MVLGSGLIASGFNKYADNEKYLVFASGVSNSANTDPGVFTRESDLLKKAIIDHPGKTFIYFSTCSIYDPMLQHSPYVKHKLAMEAVIRQYHHSYHIFRISNLVGRTDNPHTVLNFFFQRIESGISFPAWKNATRNIIDIDDAVKICDYIIRKKLLINEHINVANVRNYAVTEIIAEIENILGKKGTYELIEKGSNPSIDTSRIQKILPTLNISFDNNYLDRTLRKYYS